MRRCGWLFVTVFLCQVVSAPVSAKDTSRNNYEKLKALQRIMVLDCSAVHNVGNLHMNVTNWGVFGSYPGWQFLTNECPSAQWPANSGVEYLFCAGLWVGAKKNGIPVVSTSAYDIEFRPTTDPIDIIYEAFEGMAGGGRLPGPADDDRDGSIDEDWLNGWDDDGDGAIDEDFAAIGRQMFSCWFTDDQPQSVQIHPEHTPLHLLVRQESYQWEEERFYNFVGVEYRIKNYGTEFIEDIYIGIFADSDAGARTRENYWEDDMTGLWEGIWCAPRGDVEVPVKMSIAYFHDDDGDEGQAEGYFGVLFLGHNTDPLGETAPREIGFTSYQNFAGDLPYEKGGDPTNDFERFELLSKGGKDRNGEVARDYRALFGVGPFVSLLPDSVMVLQVAFCCGLGLNGMLDAAASATLTYEGNWFDIDGNDQTGVGGRETPLYGPVSCVEPDSCDDEQECLSAARGEIVWINADCRNELELWTNPVCPRGDATFSDYQTGVDGKETQIHWLVGTAPPPPNLRLIPGDGKITILWDNFSEITPDVSTLQIDFEGYRIWRADGWDRPLGTSILTGPSRDLWQLLEERDLVNGILPDIDFKKPLDEGGWQYEPLQYLPNRDIIIAYFEESALYAPLDTVPCPAGLSDNECDTLEAIARHNVGLEGGMEFYKYVDTNTHNGMHYFYSVTAYDHLLLDGEPIRANKYGDPSSNFVYTVPLSNAQGAQWYDTKEVYVVPNPVTRESMEPWHLNPTHEDPTGVKVEFRNLPGCRSMVRIFTLSGDMVEVLYHDGHDGNGTLPWDLVSRNGQDVTSGVYLFAVEPEDSRFPRTIGKFVVIR